MPAKTNIKIAFTFIGTLIGAGFASGREIALFFGNTGLFSPIIAAAICGGLAYVFLELGRLSNNNLLKDLFPKTNKVWNIMISLSNFIVFSAMIAGAEYAIYNAFGYIGGGLMSGIVAFAIVIGGMDRIKFLNLMIVPLIIVLIVVIYLLEPAWLVKGRLSLSAPILYACMNILSGGFLISRMGKDITSKQSKQIAIVISVILMALISLIYLSVRQNINAEMPILVIAEKYNIAIIGTLLIYLSIFTTMVSALSIASYNNAYLALFLLIAGFGVAVLGFTNIVNYTYPIIGIGGLVLSLVSIFNLIARKKRQTKRSLMPKQKCNNNSYVQ